MMNFKFEDAGTKFTAREQSNLLRFLSIKKAKQLTSTFEKHLKILTNPSLVRAMNYINYVQ